MYDESDVETYETYDDERSLEETDATQELEQQLRLRDGALTIACQSYAYAFDSDEGFFQTAFASYRRGAADGHTDVWDTSKAPECFTAVAQLLSRAAGIDFPAATTPGSGSVGAALVAGSVEDAPHPPPRQEANANGESVKPYVPSCGLQPSGIYVLGSHEGKPSPASRFLCANFSSCILIPVDAELNRAALNAAHKEHWNDMPSVSASDVDIVPGYKNTEAVGWALPVSTQTEVLAKLKALYPGWRAPTPADVRFFTKPEKHSSSGAATQQSPQAPLSPSRRSWTRNAARLMLSKERFLSCVRAAGGWAEVLFVAVDVEAYTVAAHSVPLPAEFAFVPVKWIRRSHLRRPSATSAATAPAPEEKDTTEGITTIPDEEGTAPASQSHPKKRDTRSVHFFCHPGFIPQSEEMTTLFNSTTKHLIPHKGVTFLQHDYRSIARQVDRRFVRNRRVILINKGSEVSPTLMDLQAIRWLYAAALWQQHGYADPATIDEAAVESQEIIPQAEDIHCFEVSVLEAAAAECAGLSIEEPATSAEAASKQQSNKMKKRSSKPKSKQRAAPADAAQTQAEKDAEPSCCWYHAVVDTQDLVDEGVHCAQRDAKVLALRVRTALENWMPDHLP